MTPPAAKTLEGRKAKATCSDCRIKSTGHVVAPSKQQNCKLFWENWIRYAAAWDRVGR